VKLLSRFAGRSRFAEGEPVRGRRSAHHFAPG
jgi:hypothetical protein